jgi:putative FmdB family regulatory protein
MPIYVYECSECERQSEVIVDRVTDDDIDCMFCGARAKKIPTIFNGKGWDKWAIMDNLAGKKT